MVELGPGTLYATLSRMLDSELIVQVDVPDGEDPRLRYYRITDAGRVALESEARRLAVVLDALHDKGLPGGAAGD